jgi:hypothetical protein
MRADMAKVIVERPRHGSGLASKGKGYDRARRRLAWDEQPRREGMKRRSGGGRFFNEHLGPLVRFLRSRVGRPWDGVFSEICQHINRDSVVQDHVRDHVDDLVVTRVLLVDGVPCYNGGRFHARPIAGSRFSAQFYVCPATGILKALKRRRPQKQPVRTHPPVKAGADLVCLYRDGRWHLVRVVPLPGDAWRDLSDKEDVWLGRPVRHLPEPTARETYGAAVYAVSQRRLGKKELRQWPVPVAWR